MTPLIIYLWVATFFAGMIGSMFYHDELAYDNYDDDLRLFSPKGLLFVFLVSLLWPALLCGYLYVRLSNR